MGVMSADKEEQYGDRQQELLCWSILIAAVDLLPHVEIIVGASIKLKGHAPNPVKHEK